MTRVIVVNGRPRAGKDSFIEACQTHLDFAGVPHMAFSSIDPVRDMLATAQIDTSAKTAADRNLLAAVGDALQEYGRCKTNWAIDAISMFHTENKDGVIFLHMREPGLITLVREHLFKIVLNQIKFTTILIRSDREQPITTNSADSGIGAMEYDMTLRNDGSFEDLSLLAKEVLRFNLKVI